MDASSGDLLGWISLGGSALAILVSLASAWYQQRQTIRQERTSQAEAIGHLDEGEELLEEVNELRKERRNCEDRLGELQMTNPVRAEQSSDERLLELEQNRQSEMERERERERQQLQDELAEVDEQERKLLRKACNKFWQAINKGSEKPWVAGRCFTLGNIYDQELKDLRKALIAYQTGLQCDGNDWELHYALGIVLEDTNELRKASRHFRKADKLAPLSEREKIQDAIDRVRRGLEMGSLTTRFKWYWPIRFRPPGGARL